LDCWQEQSYEDANDRDDDQEFNESEPFLVLNHTLGHSKNPQIKNEKQNKRIGFPVGRGSGIHAILTSRQSKGKKKVSVAPEINPGKTIKTATG
jgi:hypothetical protein